MFNFQCSSNTGAKTGIGKCKPQYADVKSFIILKKGYEFDISSLTATSANTFLTTSVVSGNAFPLPRVLVKNPSDMTPKSKEVAGEMKYYGNPEVRATFTLSEIFGCLQQQLVSMNNGAYSAILIDSTGKALGRIGSTSGKIKGFNLNQLWFSGINPYVSYGEISETDMMITHDPQEFEGELVYADLGFPISDLNGLIPSVITKVSNTTSAIVVKVVEACNASQPVTGLVAGNFALAQSGAVVAITGVTESSVMPGEYTIATTITENPYTVTNVPTATDLYSGSATLTYA